MPTASPVQPLSLLLLHVQSALRESMGPFPAWELRHDSVWWAPASTLLRHWRQDLTCAPAQTSSAIGRLSKKKVPMWASTSTFVRPTPLSIGFLLRDISG